MIKNKMILLLGKTRAFSSEEFFSQLKFHKVKIVDAYEEGVWAVIEGRMMSPYEQNESERLYQETKLRFINIDTIEKELAEQLDEDTLLMSLKLGGDNEKLKKYILNTAISDELFLKLLKMYKWNKEGFFENDDNRDVTAAFITRFYPNIEQNHNVQYATSGLMHLLAQTKDERILETVALLEPIQMSIASGQKEGNFNILTVIATHHLTSKAILEMLIQKACPYVKTLIAMRHDCDETMQKKLFENADDEVLLALSYNQNLARDLALKLMDEEKFAKNIAKHIKLNHEFYEMLHEKYSAYLAKNETLTPQMQEKIALSSDGDSKLALAANSNINEDVANKLISQGSEDINYALYANENTPSETLEEAYQDVLNHFSLAHNSKTPVHILELLSKSSDFKVLEGLAKNPSTPIDILYQLQLDRRLERFVKKNRAFADHIKTENIGWQV